MILQFPKSHRRIPAKEEEGNVFIDVGPFNTPYFPLNCCMLGNFSFFCCRLLNFFKINFFKKFFQEHHQSVNQFGSRSGPTFCRSWSGFKLFAKVISRQQVAASQERGRLELTLLCLLLCAYCFLRLRKKDVCLYPPQTLFVVGILFSLYPPQTLFVVGILFSRCPSVRVCVCPSITFFF